jgi:D-alanyl-D-alanine carboxypeptidase
MGALAFVMAFAPVAVAAGDTDAALRASLKADITRYLAERARPEHISAISLSVLLPRSASNINVTAGRAKYGGNGPAVTPATLFQIGSNTKAFTAVALLQLEAEGKLKIDDRIGKYFPEYPAWKSVTIRQLLNMTSGIPTYDDEQSMLSAYAANPMKHWTEKQLVAVIYPRRKSNAGWLYSNTGYILAQMIVERVTKHTYASEIRRRFLNNPALRLSSTYYEPNLYPVSVERRLVSGYFYSNDPDNAGLAPLLGKDVSRMSISWAQGAGGIVSTPEDVTRWSRALYEGPLLPAKQRVELETLVSQKTGRPVQGGATAQEPKTFGLGVGQFFMPPLGRFWFYEGMTLGYRVAYAYFPEKGLVLCVGLNSQPPHKQDQIGKLMEDVFSSLRAAGKI